MVPRCAFWTSPPGPEGAQLQREEENGSRLVKSTSAQHAEAAHSSCSRTVEVIIYLPFGFQPSLRLPGRKLRKEGREEGGKLDSSHGELVPGLGWGRAGPEGWLLRGAGRAWCFGAKVLVMRIS